jgi:hypothetical protein
VRDQLLSFAHATNYNNSRLLFTLFSVIGGILVFDLCSNNDVYAQQSYSPAPAPTPLSQLSQQTNNTGTNVPIVLRPLPGGTCPQGYHLVSGTICIKDLPSSTSQTTSTTNTTKSFSTPLSSTTQPNNTNPSNNDNNDNSNIRENFGTKILRSFNQEFK